jgi:hypothetical protein
MLYQPQFSTSDMELGHTFDALFSINSLISICIATVPEIIK